MDEHLHEFYDKLIKNNGKLIMSPECLGYKSKTNLKPTQVNTETIKDKHNKMGGVA